MIFSLNIPIDEPTPDQIAEFDDAQIEGYFVHLMESGFMNKEEVMAFIKFQTYLMSIAPFLLDEFLKRYRQTEVKIPA